MSFVSDIVSVEVDCATGMRNISSSMLKCQWVQNNTDCQSSGFFDYSYFIFCVVSENTRWMAIGLLVILLVVYFIGLSTAADSFFCPNISVIVDHLSLSHNIAGVTFLAFGNGAPDIFASLASVQNSQSPAGLAFGALLGAGMFLSTVIVGAVVFVRPFNVMQRPLLRDLVFYLFTIYWVFYILYKRRIRWIDAVGFLLLYIIYVIVVVVGRFVRKRLQARARAEAQRKLGTPMDGQGRPESSSGAVGEDDELNKYDLFFAQRHGRRSSGVNSDGDILTADSVSIAGSDVDLIIAAKTTPGDSFIQLFISMVLPFTKEEWTNSRWSNRILMVVKAPLFVLLKLTVPVVDRENWSKSLELAHCIICPIFALGVLKYIDFFIAGVFPIAVIAEALGVALAAIVYFTSKPDQPPSYHSFLAYFGFIMAVMWIYCLAREVVNVLRTVGVVLNLSHEILGLTVLAWSNSLGDLIADITVASQGYPRMAISACFGGPLFNILVGVGLPFTMNIIRTGGGDISLATSPVSQVLCLFLGISLSSSLVILPACGFRATRPYAAYLILLYLAFLTSAILTEMRLVPSLW